MDNNTLFNNFAPVLESEVLDVEDLAMLEAGRAEAECAKSCAEGCKKSCKPGNQNSNVDVLSDNDVKYDGGLF